MNSIIVGSTSSRKRTFAELISRSAVTPSLLSHSTSARPRPSLSARARREARIVSAKRLETRARQSSTVTRAIGRGVWSGPPRGASARPALHFHEDLLAPLAQFQRVLHPLDEPPRDVAIED